MLATVKIKKLKIPVIIGTRPSERKVKQEIFLTIKFDYDAGRAIKSDDVAQAVDYDQLAQMIAQSVSKTNFFLLEKLADHILSLMLKEPKVKKAAVKVSKPNALKNAKAISVSLTRER